MVKTDLDYDAFTEAKSHAEEMKSLYGQRNTRNDKMRAMYLMDWANKPEADEMQYTLSTRPRDTINGIVRIMASQMAQFNVRNTGVKIKAADLIERAIKTWWEQSSRVQRVSPLRDLILSGALYGEMHMAVTSTLEMLELVKQAQAVKKQAGKGESKAAIARAERLAAMTPYLFEVWTPGYSQHDALGLTAYYRNIKVRVADILYSYGEAGAQFAAGKSLTDEVEKHIYYNDTYYVVWVDETPFISRPHELPGIPVFTAIAEGSELFDKIEDKIQPLLSGYDKSGMWENENLLYSVLYTHVRQLGLTPLIKHMASEAAPNKKLEFDITNGLSVLNMQPGEDVQFMTSKGIVDDSFPVAAQTIEESSNRSTVHPQLFGQAYSGNKTSWEVNTTMGAAKLPIVGLHEQASLLISSAVEFALMWYADQGQTVGELKPSDVPDTIQIETTIEMQLPQDKLQMATIGGMVIEKGIADTDWVRKEIMGIGQSQEMDENIATEKMFQAMVGMYIQQRMTQTQQMPMGGQSQSMPPGGDMQGGMSPEEQMMLNGSGSQMPGMAEGQAFNPAMGGMPPAMMGQIPTAPQQQIEGV